MSNVAWSLQGRGDVTTGLPLREPRMLRLYQGLFALAALAMLLIAARLRFFVPSRHVERVRDISWLQQQER
jgi:hypothetical protein